jgi:hypothetical protein
MAEIEQAGVVDFTKTVNTTKKRKKTEPPTTKNTPKKKQKIVEEAEGWSCSLFSHSYNRPC